MLRQAGSFEAQRKRTATAVPLAAAPPASAGLSEAQRERFAVLVVRIASDRDPADFLELFGFYAPRVKSYFLRLGADVLLADEIALEVMETVWRKAAGFDPLGMSVSTWIFRIARSRRADACRIPMRRDIDPPEQFVLPTARAEPVSGVNALDLEGHVRSALRDLSPEQRETLRLAFYEGRTHREIARQWGLPMAAVQVLVHAALLSLQQAPEPGAAEDQQTTRVAWRTDSAR